MFQVDKKQASNRVMSKSAVGLLDGNSLIVLYIMKIYRIMSVWTILYILDKVYQGQYMDDVYISRRPPTSMTMLPVLLVSIEAVSFAFFFFLLLLFRNRFNVTKNTFIIDETLLRYVMVDYALTTTSIMLISTAIISTVCNKDTLRFHHDGMRGIRASSRIIFYSSIIVLLLPMFLVY